MQQCRSDIEMHHAWARALVARIEQTETMSEEEQDEGTHRASELAAIRSVLISASMMMASRQHGDGIIMQLLDDALREFDELGLVEVDSSDEDYDWGGSVADSDGGGSDEEFARDLQKTLSAERRTTQQPVELELEPEPEPEPEPGPEPQPQPEPQGTVTVSRPVERR